MTGRLPGFRSEGHGNRLSREASDAIYALNYLPNLYFSRLANIRINTERGGEEIRDRLRVHDAVEMVHRCAWRLVVGRVKR